MSKKSVKRQALFILFSLSCLAYAGPKKNPEQQQKPQQEKKTQSANQKRRPEKDDHQEQLEQSVSKGKKRLVGGPIGQLPTQHIEFMQEEKIDPSKEDPNTNININATNALNFQQESRSRFGKEEKQNSLQKPEYLTQQNTGDQILEKFLPPVLPKSVHERQEGQVENQNAQLENQNAQVDWVLELKCDISKEEIKDFLSDPDKKILKSLTPFKLCFDLNGQKNEVDLQSHKRFSEQKEIAKLKAFLEIRWLYEKGIRPRLIEDISELIKNSVDLKHSFDRTYLWTPSKQSITELLEDSGQKSYRPFCVSENADFLDEKTIERLNEKLPDWKDAKLLDVRWFQEENAVLQKVIQTFDDYIRQAKIDCSMQNLNAHNTLDLLDDKNTSRLAGLSRNIFSYMALFLGLEDCWNLAFSSKQIYKKMMTIDVAAFTHRDRFRKCFGLPNNPCLMLDTTCLKRFLLHPEKNALKKRLAQCGFYAAYLDLSWFELCRIFRNAEAFVTALNNLKIPIVLEGSVLAQIAPFFADLNISGLEIRLSANQTDLDWVLPAIRKNNLPIVTSLFCISFPHEVTPFITFLIHTGKVVRLKACRFLFAQDWDMLSLKSVRDLLISCVNSTNGIYEIAVFLNKAAPNLEKLSLFVDERDPADIYFPFIQPGSFDLKNLQFLLIPGNFKISDDFFPDFCKMLPKGLQHLDMSTRMGIVQTLHIAERFNTLKSLRLAYPVLTKNQVSLAEWLAPLSKCVYLHRLVFKLHLLDLPKAEHLSLMESLKFIVRLKWLGSREKSVGVSLNIADLRIHLDSKVNLEGLRNFATHMINAFPLLGMNIDSKNDAQKKVSICVLSDEKDIQPDVWKAGEACFAQMVQNSGAHVKFRFPKNITTYLEKSDLLSEQDKKRIVFKE